MRFFSSWIWCSSIVFLVVVGKSEWLFGSVPKTGSKSHLCLLEFGIIPNGSWWVCQAPCSFGSFLVTAHFFPVSNLHCVINLRSFPDPFKQRYQVSWMIFQKFSGTCLLVQTLPSDFENHKIMTASTMNFNHTLTVKFES